MSADNVDDSATTNKFVTSTEKSTWNGKQDALTTSSVNDGTIDKSIGFDSQGNIVKGSAGGGGAISGGYTLSITAGSLQPYCEILVLGTYNNVFGLHKLNLPAGFSLTNVIFFEILAVSAVTPYVDFTTSLYDVNGTLHNSHENNNFSNKLFVLKENTIIEVGDDD